jgi:hypothetical protein
MLHNVASHFDLCYDCFHQGAGEISPRGLLSALSALAVAFSAADSVGSSAAIDDASAKAALKLSSWLLQVTRSSSIISLLVLALNQEVGIFCCIDMVLYRFGI